VIQGLIVITTVGSFLLFCAIDAAYEAARSNKS